MAGHFVKQNIPVEMEDNAMVSMRWPGTLGQTDGSGAEPA
jgi:hypothetical protein